jgi:hypothetical protein
MAFQPEPDGPDVPPLMRRILGILILIIILLGTAVTIVYGYIINTTFDSNLQGLPLYAQLPAAAQGVFGTVVTWQLNTYAFIPGVVLILAIFGTIAAIFGTRSRHEDVQESY